MRATTASMAEAERRLQAAPQQRAALRERLLPLVVRWEWATFARHHQDPEYFALQRFARGRLLDGPPSPPVSGAHGHGFDAAGRLLVVVQQTSFPGRIYETFHIHEASRILRYYYVYHDDSGSVAVLDTDADGRVVACATAYAGGARLTQTFGYDDAGRLISRRHVGTSSDGVAVDDLVELERGPHGGVVRLWETHAGVRHLVSDRSARKTTKKKTQKKTKKKAQKKKTAKKKTATTKKKRTR